MIRYRRVWICIEGKILDYLKCVCRLKSCKITLLQEELEALEMTGR